VSPSADLRQPARPTVKLLADTASLGGFLENDKVFILIDPLGKISLIFTATSYNPADSPEC
jgi:hypothetical protein